MFTKATLPLNPELIERARYKLLRWQPTEIVLINYVSKVPQNLNEICICNAYFVRSFEPTIYCIARRLDVTSKTS